MAVENPYWSIPPFKDRILPLDPHTYIHTCTRAYTHTPTHTYTHACTHTHTHTHTHAHTPHTHPLNEEFIVSVV